MQSRRTSWRPSALRFTSRTSGAAPPPTANPNRQRTGKPARRAQAPWPFHQRPCPYFAPHPVASQGRLVVCVGEEGCEPRIHLTACAQQSDNRNSNSTDRATDTLRSISLPCRCAYIRIRAVAVRSPQPGGLTVVPSMSRVLQHPRRTKSYPRRRRASSEGRLELTLQADSCSKPAAIAQCVTSETISVTMQAPLRCRVPCCPPFNRAGPRITPTCITARRRDGPPHFVKLQCSRRLVLDM